MSEVSVDDEAMAMLRTLDAVFPAVHTMTPTEARAVIAARRQAVTNVDDVAATRDLLIEGPGGALPVRIYRPHSAGSSAGPGIVFFHGGGFVFCDLDSHDGFCRAMARQTGAVVVSVAYRLAPENRAPAAAEDAFAAYRWTLEHADALNVDTSRVAVAGDSAGGNLAAVTAVACRDRGVGMPVAQALWYPMLDPTCDTASYRRYATGAVNTEAAMRWYWQNYLGGDALPEPACVVAPARADSHAGLPPALVLTAEKDPLHDEGAAYAETLRNAGVPVVHRDFPGLFHGFLTMMAFAPGRSARELVFGDLRSLLATSVRGVPA